MNTARALLIAVSGPDGAGGASLVRRLAGLLRERGFAVTVLQGHGCFLCRRFGSSPQARGEEETVRRAAGPARRGSWARRAHALLDAGELSVRTSLARRALSVRSPGRRAVVLTDRGPLDGLVAFGLPPGLRSSDRFVRLAGRYDLTLLVESAPVPLRGPGRERTAGTPDRLWARYRTWASRLPGVVRLDGDRAPSRVSVAALDRVLDTVRTRHLPDVGNMTQPGRRKRIVVSIFDDAGNPDYRGGGALVVDKVARRLLDDFDVTVVTAGRRGGSVRRDGIRYVRLPVRWAGPRAGQLLFMTLLPFVARRLPHDAWLENFTPPFSTSFLPLFSRAPVVGIDQGRSAEALWRRYHIPFFLVERLGLRCYRHIVVMNEADASAVRRLSSRADVQVIANGVEQRQIDDARIGAGEYILFLGRIDTWGKGLDLLLDAYRQSRPPLPLLLAGSGTQAEERKLAALLAAHPGSVRWVGFAGEGLKRDLLRNSAFLVMPSRHETFGLVALEGMSYGKPIVHFDLPALRWMRGGGDVAVPPFDVAELGDRMRMLASDEEARRALGRQAGHAAQHYTWDEMTGRYLALTRRLVDGPARGRRPRKERRGEPWPTTP
ncbi:glycosyltransferase [Streptomyces sp. Je 1-79]|uniref:glycosyltransferase n=1 Tax=Streptomyces sp. Je 1-79 TaxID=2943847 RepID=UPI0021A6ED14|nr:glycosyltransferase [Streptomyces sp. Je 1-79]MCT4354023.1 glycosyltransferase [Streptomyces sp. Je 1-79]